MLRRHVRTCIKILTAGALTLALSAGRSAYVLTANTRSRSTHLKGATMRPEILAAIRLAGDQILNRPVIILGTHRPGGETAVNIARPLSDVTVSPGRKSTESVLCVTFKHDEIVIEPASLIVGERQEEGADCGLSRVAVMACSYMLNHRDIGSEFELAIGKSGNTYRVTATRIPYTPDSFVSVKIAIKAGRLELVPEK